MSTFLEGQSPSAPAWPAQAGGAVRWITTNNPFYVVSAGLFLAGLWLSCDPEKAEDTWALMTGLAGYTLLLAGTAFVLIRFGKVWDDTRTVLLLVVLMFLATSVTFDRALVFSPLRGSVCNVLALVFAIVVSELLLRGIRLKLPMGFRLPYYLLLGLYFLYPVFLATALNLRNPRSEPVMWGMFGFCTLAALIFLTLLPAVRRGGAYVRNNGSPWPWPLFPWSLFGLLGLAAPARSILLCYSMHLIDVRDLYEVTFGFYFLVPFGLVVAVLLLEAGLKSNRIGVIWTALALPIVLVVLSVLGHRDERVYVEFLAMFKNRLGAGPLYCTLAAAAAFYSYAAARRAEYALGAITAMLALLACVRPDAIGLQWDIVAMPHPAAWIAASTLLLGLGIWRGVSLLCLAGGIGLTVAVAVAFPTDGLLAPYRGLTVFHLVVLTLLILGASFDDGLAHALRFLGSFLLLVACIGATILPIGSASMPPWALQLYPLAVVPLLAAYGYWLWHPPTLVMATSILALWCVGTGWQIYRLLRHIIVGLDYLALSLLVFAAALGISLSKSGVFARWLSALRERWADVSD